MPGEVDRQEEPETSRPGRVRFWRKWWEENAGKVVRGKVMPACRRLDKTDSRSRFTAANLLLCGPAATMDTGYVDETALDSPAWLPR